MLVDNIFVIFNFYPVQRDVVKKFMSFCLPSACCLLTPNIDYL